MPVALEQKLVLFEEAGEGGGYPSLRQERGTWNRHFQTKKPAGSLESASTRVESIAEASPRHRDTSQSMPHDRV